MTRAHAATEPRPYYEARREGAGERPRLLLISYHFPPGTTAGALRWQKLAPLAAERGWALDVITLDPSQLDRPDTDRLAELPPGTRLYGVSERPIAVERLEAGLLRLRRGVGRAVRAVRAGGRGGRGGGGGRGEPGGSDRPEAGAGPARPESLAPEAFLRLPRTPRELLRAYWAWLDHARLGVWARDAARLGMRLYRPDVHAAVVSCGPPHRAVHDAARRIAVRTGLPLVMDLRDPWSIPRRLPEYTASPVAFRLAARQERRAVERAALVVANTEPVRAAMEARYGDVAARFLTVTNGFDEESIPRSRAGDCFVMTYAGGIYLDRDPRPFFRAAGRVADELRLEPDRFRIELIGRVQEYCGVSIQRLAEEAGVARHLRTSPPVPRGELLEAMAGSSVLVSLPQDSPWAIPSKIFEYMQFDAWLLVMADRGSPVEVLLRGTDADVVAPGDIEAIAAALRRRYRQFERGERPVRLAQDERYSRRYQASLLFSAIETCVSNCGRPVPGPAAPRTGGASSAPRLSTAIAGGRP